MTLRRRDRPVGDKGGCRRRRRRRSAAGGEKSDGADQYRAGKEQASNPLDDAHVQILQVQADLVENRTADCPQMTLGNLSALHLRSKARNVCRLKLYTGTKPEC